MTRPHLSVPQRPATISVSQWKKDIRRDPTLAPKQKEHLVRLVDRAAALIGSDTISTKLSRRKKVPSKLKEPKETNTTNTFEKQFDEWSTIPWTPKRGNTCCLS